MGSYMYIYNIYMYKYNILFYLYVYFILVKCIEGYTYI